MSTASVFPLGARLSSARADRTPLERDDARRSPDRSWGETLLHFEGTLHTEDVLDPDELSQLRHRLLGALDELIDRIAAIKAVRRRRNGQTADTVDAVLADRVAVHERRLGDTAAALAAISAGVYGWCLRCRVPIGFEALWADPLITSCPTCRRPVDQGVSTSEEPVR